MTAYDRPAIDAKTLRPRTQLVHGGAMRSAFGETSEALFLTQGFVYNSSEVAEARFTGEDEGFNTAASATRRSPCSSSAWPCSKAPRPPAPPPPAWPRLRRR